MTGYLFYDQDDPTERVHFAPNPGSAAAFLKEAEGHLVLRPVKEPSDLGTVPMPTLRQLYRTVVAEGKAPRSKAQIASKIYEAVNQRAPRPQTRRRVGDRARELIAKGKGLDAVLAQIHREFPESRATRRDMYIYRRQVRSAG